MVYEYHDRKIKFTLRQWLLHPVITFNAWKTRNFPVTDLDHPENNCPWCGFDHHFYDRYHLTLKQEYYKIGEQSSLPENLDIEN